MMGGALDNGPLSQALHCEPQRMPKRMARRALAARAAMYCIKESLAGVDALIDVAHWIATGRTLTGYPKSEQAGEASNTPQFTMAGVAAEVVECTSCRHWAKWHLYRSDDQRWMYGACDRTYPGGLGCSCLGFTIAEPIKQR